MGHTKPGSATNYARTSLQTWQRKETLPDVPQVRNARLAVMERYTEVGARGLILDGAFDIETVAQLFLQNVLNAAVLKQADRLAKHADTFRRLRAEATRHWHMLAEIDDEQHVLDYEEILAKRRQDTDGT